MRTDRPSLPLRSLATGFTLVEMMITVVILAVLLALAVPSMREMIARKRVESIAKELATDLRLLRTQAVQRRSAVQIRFGSNTESTCYVLFGREGFICNCARTDGLPSCGDPATPGASIEFKTVSIRRDRGIELSSVPSSLDLEGFNGLPSGNQAIRASVRGTVLGGELQVYTKTDDLIVPRICSVSGHAGAFQPCPQ